MRFRIFSVFLFTLVSFVQGQSVDFKGPNGGDVRSITLNPRRPNILIIGTTDGQIFRSEDSARHWRRSAGLGRGTVVDNLIFDPNVENRMYAGVWDLRTTNGGNLFRSDDEGVTWQPVPMAPGGASVRSVAVAPSDSNTIVVGTLDGVYLSRDAGKSWTLISGAEKDLKNIQSVAVDPRDNSVIYAGTWHLGAKTTDGGKSWKWIKEGMIDDSDLFSISIHPTEFDLVYVSACSGVYKSINGGNLWVKLRNGLTTEARRTHTVVIDPVNHNRVFAGTTLGLYLSEDAGSSWHRITTADLIINRMAINPQNNKEIYLAAEDAGILKSTDGGKTFVPSNDGFIHRQISQVVVDPTVKDRLYTAVLYDGTYGGFFISDDGGRNWKQSNSGIASEELDIYSILPSTNDKTIYATTDGGIYVSKNRGESWAKLGSPRLAVQGKPKSAQITTPGKGLRTKVFQLQFLTPDERKLVAAALDGIYFGDLKTGKWTRVMLPQYTGSVYFVHVERDTNALFAGSDSGLFISRDGGTTWRLSSQGLPIASPIQSFVRMPQDKALLVGTHYGVYRSADDGETWSKITQGIPPISISALKISTDGRALYAAEYVEGNVYVSLDGGATWSPANRQVNASVSSLTVSPGDDSLLLLGSVSDGILGLRVRSVTGMLAGQQN
ncbi:MAG TPA: hypothetical protein VGL91_05145 [Acidobacteriota bacterium]|jgi:photosystem II stability/assembly factor-like uncharacterized protein